jgi:hypothetical protein
MGDISKGEANTFYPVKKCTKSLLVNIVLSLYRNSYMFHRKKVKNTNMVMVNSCCSFVNKN